MNTPLNGSEVGLPMKKVRESFQPAHLLPTRLFFPSRFGCHKKIHSHKELTPCEELISHDQPPKMPRDPASPSAAQTIIADPEGDIVFMVGRKETDQKSILVSSKVLSLASPAFAALFSPRWSEGADKSSSIIPRQIDLPDDDTATMGWICQALHFRKNIPTDIGLHVWKRLQKLVTSTTLV